MKKLLLIAVAVMFLVGGTAPVFAEEGNSIINHNTVNGEIEINKKITFLPFVDRVSITAGKVILANVFGNEFDPVDGDKGWYGVLTFKIDLD